MTETPAAALPSRKERILSLLRPFSRPALIVAAHFALFFLARLALLLVHRKDFAPLSGGETAWAFVRGFRFDGAILFLIIGIPVFLLLLPFPWTRGRLWQGIWGWSCYATFLLFGFVLAVDVVYFGHVHRHAGAEVNILGEALETVALSAAIQYLLPLVVLLAAGTGVFFLWRRLMKAEAPPATDRVVRLGLALLSFWLMYQGARGSFGPHRTKVVHAFEGVPQAAGYLALNGPFSILHSLDYARSVRCDYYPWEDAVRTVRETLFAEGESSGAAEYPLLRARTAKAGAKPNVVVIMLESWDAFYADAHRREMGLEPLGLTPCYDAISREGVLFPRFYAAGQRSMDGMSAILCGFPTLPRTPYLGRGMEQSGLPFLGHLARQEGYETWFAQSSKRASFRNDALSALAGFTNYLGAEDIPPGSPAASRAVLAGAAWDHEMFDEANRRLASAKRPFLAFLYTASTHAPFAWPGKEWEKHPGRYQNSLGYGDWALGRFFAAAKASGYFDSTIFILASDHIGGGGGVTAGDPSTLHHIPGLVIAPGLKPGVDRRVAGQLDVIPTVAHLAGWGAAHSALGRSLVAEVGPNGGAFCVQGETILRIEDGGSMAVNVGGRTVSRASGKGADLEALERRLLSLHQVAATLLRQNRLYTNATGARKE